MEEDDDTNLGNYVPIPPKVDCITIDDNVIHYWTKPLLPLLNFSLSHRLFKRCNSAYKDKRDVSQLDNVDLVIGGDHGQRKFRMVLKIICRKEDMSVIDSWVVKIGHIDCKKDTYDVLKQTIIPFINHDINKLIEQKA